VEVCGQQFFPDPGFTQDQDRRVGRRHLLRLGEHALQDLALPHHAMLPAFNLNLLPKILVLFLQLVLEPFHLRCALRHQAFQIMLVPGQNFLRPLSLFHLPDQSLLVLFLPCQSVP